MTHTPAHLAASCSICGISGFEANSPCPLHAAAPDLLAALRELLPVAERFFVNYTQTATEDLENGALIRQAHAAIAKAERD